MFLDLQAGKCKNEMPIPGGGFCCIISGQGISALTLFQRQSPHDLKTSREAPPPNTGALDTKFPKFKPWQPPSKQHQSEIGEASTVEAEWTLDSGLACDVPS
jgi:hypothetical protein